MAQSNSTQDSIVRQSSLKFVTEYCRSIGTPLTLKEVIGITNVITDYCQNGYSSEISKRIDSIDTHIQKKFEESL